MYIPNASNIFVNNQLVSSVGKISQNTENEEVDVFKQIIRFQKPADTLDVVIHVSNFSFHRAGLINHLYFGSHDAVYDGRFFVFGMKMFLIGVMTIMSIFFLAFYFYRKREKVALYIGLFTLLMSIYACLTGLPQLILFYDIPFSVQTNLIRIIQYLLPIVLVLFFKDAYPHEYKKWTLYTFATPFILLIFITLTFSISQTSGLIRVFWYSVIILFLYYLYILILAIKNKRFGAKTLLIGFGILYLFAVNEILHYMEIINTGSLYDLGVFLFLISLAFYLSARFAKTFNENEKLALDLYEINRNLEDIVKQRTQEINLQKEEILAQAEQLKSTNERLIELDYYKESLTQMIVHDLKSPLGVICGMPDILKEGDDLSLIKDAGKQMLDLVTNILDVKKYESSEMKLNKTVFFIKKIVEEAIAHTHYLHFSKNIEFSIQIDSDLEIFADKEIIQRIVINLLSNAIKYSRRKGLIVIKAIHNSEGLTEISVKDTGIGIAPEMIERIFDKYVQAQAKKMGNIRSTGLGLTFCKLAVEAHNGTIWAESEQDKGAIFIFTIPQNK